METAKKQKPKYNILQNSVFMLKGAWTEGHRGVIFICIVTAVLAVGTSLLGLFVAPTILQAIQDAVPLSELVRLIVIFAVAMLAVGATSAYVETNTLFGRIDFRKVFFGNRINGKASKTSYANWGITEFREKLSRAYDNTSSNSAASEAYWATLTKFLTNAIGLVVYLFLLAGLTPWVMMLVLATTVVGFFIDRHTMGWRYRHKAEETKYTNHLWYIMQKSEEKGLAKDIRLFGMGPWLADVYNSTFKLYRNFIGRNERQRLIGDISDVVVAFARNGIAYIYLLGLVISGGLSAPEFLLFFTAVGGFATWVGGVLDDVNTMRTQCLEISIIREFFDYPEPFKFEEGLPLEPESGKGYELTMRNVSFKYPETDEYTLTDINLTIKPVENLAIVGLNGAGKTTLVKLLCGLLDPTQGEILLNGQDIRQYNRRDIYRHFTAVFQEHTLMPVSIEENIAQTIPSEIDKVRVVEAAQQAGIDKKIEDLPRGYDTPFSKQIYDDGVEFSGGETQRLLLARALYKDAPIILLDEPTAALDPIAESEMYEKYHSLTEGRTSLYISHRLSSTRFCDRVILIDGGKITEEGTHSELVKQGGKYAELYELQSHYYKEDMTHE